MIKRAVLFFVLAGFISCKKEAKTEKETEDSLETSSITTLDYNGLKPLLQKEDDKTYIVNFWATWCAPCVKELPYFEEINESYADKNVEVVLVSLDFPDQVEKRLIPFLEKRQLQSKVVLLDDTNENFWINDIDSSWSGAIPATLIYNKSNRKFYEQSFDYTALENELKQFLN